MLTRVFECFMWRSDVRYQTFQQRPIRKFPMPIDGAFPRHLGAWDRNTVGVAFWRCFIQLFRDRELGVFGSEHDDGGVQGFAPCVGSGSNYGEGMPLWMRRGRCCQTDDLVRRATRGAESIAVVQPIHNERQYWVRARQVGCVGESGPSSAMTYLGLSAPRTGMLKDSNSRWSKTRQGGLVMQGRYGSTETQRDVQI